MMEALFVFLSYVFGSVIAFGLLVLIINYVEALGPLPDMKQDTER